MSVNTLARTALGNVDNALVAVTRNASGATGVEHLATRSFHAFEGTIDDAHALGRHLADGQLQRIVNGGDETAANVLGVLHQDGMVHGSVILRGSDPFGEALRGADLLGSSVAPTGRPTILSQHPALAGIVADGRWLPLR
jgi:hypothetical protein